MSDNRKVGGWIARCRTWLIILLISAALFLVLEGGVRLFWPQDVRTEYVDGLSLGVEDATLGYVYRPNAETIERTPEYVVSYKTSSQGLRDAGIYSAKPIKTSIYRIVSKSSGPAG